MISKRFAVANHKVSVKAQFDPLFTIVTLKNSKHESAGASKRANYRGQTHDIYSAKRGLMTAADRAASRFPLLSGRKVRGEFFKKLEASMEKELMAAQALFEPASIEHAKQ